MKIEEIKQIDIIKHFLIDDKDFSGDYCSIELRVNDENVIEYGDDYHDKGDEKVEGFLDALKYLGCKVEPSHEEIADYEY